MKHGSFFRLSAAITALLMIFTACSADQPAEEAKTESTQMTSAPQVITETTTVSSAPSETQESVYEEKIPEIGPSVYNSTLQAIYDAITAYDENLFVDFEGMVGVSESLHYETIESVLDNTGYAIKDINGDGVPELVIASVNERVDGKCFGSALYSLFTYADDKAVCLLEGYARSRYDLFEDGTVYNNGSGGAIYYVSSTYRLPSGGNSLECTECYFTYERNGDYEDIGVYRSTSGSCEVSEAEETDMTLDDFFLLTEELGTQAVSVELTPFSQYTAID